VLHRLRISDVLCECMTDGLDTACELCPPDGADFLPEKILQASEGDYTCAEANEWVQSSERAERMSCPDAAVYWGRILGCCKDGPPSAPPPPRPPPCDICPDDMVLLDEHILTDSYDGETIEYTCKEAQDWVNTEAATMGCSEAAAYWAEPCCRPGPCVSKCESAAALEYSLPERCSWYGFCNGCDSCSDGCNGKCGASSPFSWVQKCSWEVCAGCAACPQPDAASYRSRCDSWCESKDYTESQRCSWSSCAACGMCSEVKQGYEDSGCPAECYTAKHGRTWVESCAFAECAGCMACDDSKH